MIASDLIDKLRLRMTGRITANYSDDFLESELDTAISKVAEKRWVEVDELEDKFANDVVNIALYNIALIGGDFQTAHSENGINRTFITENEILQNITPKARVL